MVCCSFGLYETDLHSDTSGMCCCLSSSVSFFFMFPLLMKDLILVNHEDLVLRFSSVNPSNLF
ncbi:hypothetical protein AtNW77_Chr1g0060791 [Arabidopsis thaliana]